MADNISADLWFLGIIFEVPLSYIPSKTPLELFEKHVKQAEGAARQIVGHFARSGAVAYKEDCISEAKIGLLQAAERYDPAKNDNFWRYAQRRVRGAVYDYLRTERVIVKSGLPDHTALMFISGDEVPSWEDAESLFDNLPDLDSFHSHIDNDLDIERVFAEAHLSSVEESIILQHIEGMPNTRAAKGIGCSVNYLSDIVQSAKDKLAGAWCQVRGEAIENRVRYHQVRTNDPCMALPSPLPAIQFATISTP